MLTALCVLTLLGATSSEAARRVDLRVARIDAGAVKVENVHARLDEATAAPALSLQLAIASIDVSALKLRLDRVEWQCEQLSMADGLACEGPMRLSGRDAGRLVVDLTSAQTRGEWSQGPRRVALAKDLQSPWRVDLKRVPLLWLDAFVRSLWAGGSVSSGEVSGQVRLPERPGMTLVEADLRLTGLGFDSPDGALAGAGLDVPVTLQYSASSTLTTIRAEGRLQAGEALVSPVYLAVPTAGIGWSLAAESGADGRWRVPAWRWVDREALTADGDAMLDAEGTVVSLGARAASPDLAALRSRYLDGVLAPTGFGELQLGGQGTGSFAFDGEGMAALEIDLIKALAIDPRGRFSLAGVDGGLRWSRDSDVADSRLGWQAAALYGIGIGASALSFESRDGQLALAQPMRAGMLGGELRLDRLVWRPPRGETPVRIEMGLALERLDLGSLSQRLGWPAFEGTVDGVLPRALYQDNRITFEGGLAMGLFGGQVNIDALALERPFGVAPSLAANVRFSDIDLAPLTRAFGFGEITGRLDGRLGDLRLVDWTPVSFDARLLTDRQWKGSRRISQRAVQDISDLGGSGLIAGLQAQLLRAFDDFGYDRIGIGCVLKDNRCAMTGLKKRGEGYVIIEGRSLPRIEVVGFRRTVDWPTLVDRLKAATEGDTLRID